MKGLSMSGYRLTHLLESVSICPMLLPCASKTLNNYVQLLVLKGVGIQGRQSESRR